MDKNRCPKVSVIIPTYNHAQYVVETIQSVLKQSFRDFEVIVVNDGSSDQTENVLKPYIDAGLIHYVRQENQGVAIARNHGLALAVGGYIAFLDDDDLWPPDKLEWQVEFLDHSDAVLIGGGCYSNESEDPDLLAGADPVRPLQDRDLFRRNPFSSPGQTLLRRSAMEQVGGFDPEIWGADDLDLWMRLLSAGPLFISRKPALFYRLHQHNASSDAIKMATNLEKVFAKNLMLFPVSKQPKLQQLGARFIFRYCGRRIIWEAIEHLLAGNLAKAQPLLRYGLSNFLTRSLKDPLFLVYIASAILSAPMKINQKTRLT
jgi:glycosyltransferase involved in cell wall biosynthesis